MIVGGIMISVGDFPDGSLQRFALLPVFGKQHSGIGRGRSVYVDEGDRVTGTRAQISTHK